MNPRNRELLLLLPAVFIATLGFTVVYARQTGSPAWAPLAHGAVFLGLFGIAHVCVRFLAPRADPYLLPVTALLCGLGILMIYRLDPDRAFLQSLWLGVGIVFFIVVLVSARHLERLAEYKYLLGLAGLALLIFTIVVAPETHGARLWVRIGGIGFQPSEFAKLLLIVFFAAYLRDVRELLTVSTRKILGVAVPPFRYLAPLFIIWGLSVLLMIFMKDLGTGLLFFGALLALMYVATGRAFYVVVGLVLFSLGAFGLYEIFSHVQTRVDIWLDPWQDPSGAGYQIVQSLFTLASGGLFGQGLGAGYLITLSGNPAIPALETDFIFSALAEELGLAGAAAVIMMYVIFLYRGFRAALVAGHDFARLLAAGLTVVFSLQAFLIMGGVTKLIPLTGITLPFLSYGGSSIVSNLGLLALLLLVSHDSPQEQGGDLALSNDHQGIRVVRNA